MCHLELGEEKIKRLKESWEAFVAEARKPKPSVLATLTCFGTQDYIHAAQLVMQWPDERIEYVKPYHLLEGGFDRWTDSILEEVQSIGKGLALILIDEPQPIEHCPCCDIGLSHTVKPALALKLTDPDWNTLSLCSVYINPSQPSLAISIGLRDQHLFSGHLHLCRDRSIHYACDYYEECLPITPKPSVRAQVTRIVSKIIRDWEPANLLVGTGDHDSPTLIEDLELPICWERKPANKSFNRDALKRAR